MPQVGVGGIQLPQLRTRICSLAFLGLFSHSVVTAWGWQPPWNPGLMGEARGWSLGRGFLSEQANTPRGSPVTVCVDMKERVGRGDRAGQALTPSSAHPFSLPEKIFSEVTPKCEKCQSVVKPGEPWDQEPPQLTPSQEGCPSHSPCLWPPSVPDPDLSRGGRGGPQPQLSQVLHGSHPPPAFSSCLSSHAPSLCLPPLFHRLSVSVSVHLSLPQTLYSSARTSQRGSSPACSQ